MENRYGKQEAFKGIGPDGQAALRRSTVLVAGCGATGGTIAALMVRAGVGRVRIVDRDFPELGNLGRQLLYDEEDVRAGTPKAVAAERKLRQVNSEVDVEGVVADISPANIGELTRGADLILEGLDNQETRYLLNDAAVSKNIPWVYAGCIGSAGNVMAIFPGRTPCLRCLFPSPAPPGLLPTCDTAGIIGPAASTTASLAAAEGLKILTGQLKPENVKLITFDLWSASFREALMTSGPREGCPCCGGKTYEFMNGPESPAKAMMCGADAVQITGILGGGADLKKIAATLPPGAVISANEYLLRFSAENCRLAVFADGRIIVQGTTDESRARALAESCLGA